MTSAREEQYPVCPFRLGKPNVASKIVEMPYKRGHDLLDPGISSRGYAAQRFVGDGEFVEIAHGYFHHPRSSVHATAVIRLTGRQILQVRTISRTGSFRDRKRITSRKVRFWRIPQPVEQCKACRLRNPDSPHPIP